MNNVTTNNPRPTAEVLMDEETGIVEVRMVRGGSKADSSVQAMLLFLILTELRTLTAATEALGK